MARTALPAALVAVSLHNVLNRPTRPCLRCRLDEYRQNLRLIEETKTAPNGSGSRESDAVRQMAEMPSGGSTAALFADMPRHSSQLAARPLGNPRQGGSGRDHHRPRSRREQGPASSAVSVPPPEDSIPLLCRALDQSTQWMVHRDILPRSTGQCPNCESPSPLLPDICEWPTRHSSPVKCSRCRPVKTGQASSIRALFRSF